MSTGTLISWNRAYEAAKAMSTSLQLISTRTKAAGSLRRRQQEVSDLEFVLEPTFQPDLLREPVPEIDRVRRELELWGDVEAGGDRYIRVRTSVWGIPGARYTCRTGSLLDGGNGRRTELPDVSRTCRVPVA